MGASVPQPPKIERREQQLREEDFRERESHVNTWLALILILAAILAALLPGT